MARPMPREAPVTNAIFPASGSFTGLILGQSASSWPKHVVPSVSGVDVFAQVCVGRDVSFAETETGPYSDAHGIQSSRASRAPANMLMRTQTSIVSRDCGCLFALLKLWSSGNQRFR
jgi:hypothetical protein